jgi:hypothetical protein
MNKRLWDWIECYYTHQGNSVPSKLWPMQQSLYRLTKFLGQGLGSAQPISRWLLNGILCTDQSFSSNFTRWLSPNWDVLKLVFHSTLGFRMISAYQTRFHTNLISFISKHNHVLDMIILFPSSPPIINPFYFLH